jgi:hypothetical protein
MTQMGFRSAPAPNSAPFPVGKIPDDATQIVKNDTATNTTVTMHTVTAGKTFYLCHYGYGIASAAPGDNGGMFVTDNNDKVQYTIVGAVITVADQEAFAAPMMPPLELASGWHILLTSGTATGISMGFIHGYER